MSSPNRKESKHLKRYVMTTEFPEVAHKLLIEQRVLPEFWLSGIDNCKVIVLQSYMHPEYSPRELIMWISDAIGCGLVLSYHTEEKKEEGVQ